MGPSGAVYVGTDSGRIHRLSPDGEKVWGFEAHGAIARSPVLGPSGTLYVPAWGHQMPLWKTKDHPRQRLYALAADDGEKTWSLGIADYVASAPAVAASGTIFFGSDDNHVYALTPP